MYRPLRPHMGWSHHRPPGPAQWRPSGGPRAPFHGQRQRFYQPRQPFQPVNDNFWCETCDRGFPTEDILNKHKQQHQKCNIDGCQFIAHPKVITKHIQMQHSTGLYKKIANLKNPEEIEKWREERRKRYPTKSNIDKKAAELKEKIERGEKMGLDRDRRHREKAAREQDNKSGQGVKRRSNMRNENQSRSKIRKNNPSEQNNKRQPKPKTSLESSSIDDNKLKPFAGIINLQMDSDEEVEYDTTMNDLIEDDDREVKAVEFEKTDNNKSEPVVCGALSALICDYGSSDEEASIEIVAHSNTNKRKKPQTIENNKTKNPKDGDELHLKKTNPENSIDRTKAPEIIVNLKEINQDIQQNNDTVNKITELQIKKIETIINSVENGNIANDVIQVSQLNTNEEKTRGVQICDNKSEVKFREPSLEPQKDEDSDSGPEEIKTETKKEENSQSVAEHSKPRDVRRRMTRGRHQQSYQHRRPKLPSTLLQKLLAKEMQQERNIVLQCIRYICKSDFFDNKKE